MTTTTQPNAEIVERTSTFERVASEALANVLSGVGLGLLTGVALWVAACTWPTVATWATASAIAWAGVINWLRFSQDEINNRLTFYRMAKNITELNESVAALESENDVLIRKNQWLEQRSRTPLRVNGKALEPEDNPAYDDAITLIEKRFGAGVPVTARLMMASGWTQARYTAALTVLSDAHIVEVRGTQTRWNEYHSPAEACSVLSLNTPVALYADTSIQAGGAN